MAAAASAGTLVRIGAMGFAVVVAPEADRLAGRLHDAGALLLFDPVYIGGCATAPQSPETMTTL